MSKYSFTLTPSGIRHWGMSLPMLVAFASLYALPYNVQTWLPERTLIVAGLLFALLSVYSYLVRGNGPGLSLRARRSLGFRANVPRSRTSTLTVHIDDVHWTELAHNGTPSTYVIEPQSRVTLFAIFLSLREQGGKKRYRWLFPGECEPVVYRRLVRLVRHFPTN